MKPRNPLRRRFNDERGELWTLALVIACLLGMYYAHPVHTLQNVIVRRKVHNFRYSFQYESGGHVFFHDICNDGIPVPEFSAGLVLDEVDFIEQGSCWSLNPDLQGAYYKRRDGEGNPVFTK